MNNVCIASKSSFLRFIPLFIAALIISFATAASVSAQTSPNDGTTPTGMTPGAPAGSYPLSGFENVNLYNGNLNFQLPLLSVGGRGGAGYTMTLGIDNKNWNVRTVENPDPDIDPGVTHIPTPSLWGHGPGYTPGALIGRHGGASVTVCPGNRTTWWQSTLTRLTFIAAGGTEYELRDRETNGQPLPSSNLCTPSATAGSRGKVFYTADGTSATFISDAVITDVISTHGPRLIYPSGYLMLRDGTRYRIDAGEVTWMRDRNGNTLSFALVTNEAGNSIYTITDSLNRKITVTGVGTTGNDYDEIAYQGFGGAARTIRVHWGPLSTVLRQSQGTEPASHFQIQKYRGLFPEFIGASTSTDFNPGVVSAVELPDGRQYQLRYNSYAELARVELPTGGAFEYDHTSTSGALAGSDDGFVYRRVTERRVYKDGVTLESRTTYRSPPINDIDAVVTVDQLNPSDTLLGRSKHYFHSNAWSSFFDKTGISYSGYREGREYQTELYAPDGTTLLRKSSHTWQQPAAGLNWPLTQAETSDTAKPNNPQLTEALTTLSDTNQVAKQTFAYDLYNNQTDVYEFNYEAGQAGTLARRTHTDYLTVHPVSSSDYACNPASTCGTNADIANVIHIRNLPKETAVYDGNGNRKALSTVEYDNYDIVANHGALEPRVDVSGFDPSFSTAYKSRGNITGATRHLLNESGVSVGSISSYAQYDVLGNVIKAMDGRGYLTSFDFSDRFGTPNGETDTNPGPTNLGMLKSYALPWKVTNALNQSVYTQYDYYTGRPVDAKDLNGVVTTGDSYNDPLDRPTRVIRGANQIAALQSQTTFTYDDVNRIVTTTSDQTSFNDNLLKSEIVYDKLGRVVEKRTYEDATTFIAVQQEYDALGRAYRTSNPFRAGASTVWTTTSFDGLGRVLSVVTPDSASVITGYSGNTVRVTDQAQKKRKSVTDALGRLIEVYEDPDGVNYLTSYKYDTLDNLTRVTQGNQQRDFVYDSLKRLTSAANPESGVVTYKYDDNGNLLVKTDTRGVSAHYSYDALNRQERRWYNDSDSLTALNNNNSGLPSDTQATAEVHFYYGEQQLPGTAPIYDHGAAIGRLVATTFGGANSDGDYYGYDPLGRQNLKIQRTMGVDYKASVAFNRADQIISQTYPSEHSVTYNYDRSGRLADKDAQNVAFTGNLGDGVTRTYSSGILYSPFGGLTKEQFGTDTPIYNKLFYNVRGQLAEIRESTSYTGPGDTTWDRGAIINHYSDSCWGMCGGSNSSTAMTDNNGNLKKQDNYIPGATQVTFTHLYHYDDLNRLQDMAELKSVNGGTATQSFTQAYTYDRFGNRSINQAGTTQGAGINSTQAAVVANTTTNRMYAPGETEANHPLIDYDAAGNQKKDYYTDPAVDYDRVYDAENRMVSATATDQFGSQTSSYTYDGNGARVKRNVKGTGTTQVYGLGGELLAEYAATGALQKEYGYRNGQLLVTAEATEPATRVNVALAANGGTATASSTVSGYAASKAIDGNRQGGDPNFWADANPGSFPDWLEVDFNGTKSIGEIDVITLQDNLSSPGEPTLTQTFSNYGTTAYDVQYWNGTSWATIDNGSVTGNNKVWRQFTFTPVSTSKIRVVVNAVPDNNYSRVVELEAWSGPPPANVALATNGGTTTASSQLSGYAASKAIDGDRKGGDPYFWADTNPGSFPDWVEVDFNGTKSIGEIDVITLQDNLNSPSEPTLTQTFSNYGAAAYDVQYWNPAMSEWTTVTGGSVTGNNKVWRQFTFTPVSTSKIRVVVNAVPDNNYSRIVEVEAWTANTGGTSANVNWLVTDQLGTPRMVFDQTGSLANMKRHDYLPFGEELFVRPDGRTTSQGYSTNVNDGPRQKFTLKERDNETGLDYFGARYFASTQGRFTTPDPLLASGRIEDPQAWNRYAYTLNNPVKYIDPTGMFVWDASLGSGADDKDVSGSIRDKRKEIRAAIADANKALNSGNLNSTQKAKLERALGSYGTEGIANGVTLALGTVEKGAAADSGFAKNQPTILYDQSTGNSTANLTVTFAKGQTVSAEDFAHEGSHNADRQELVAALVRASGDPSAEWGYMPENITRHQTESLAYRVGASVAQGLGRNLNPGGYEVWNTGWREADRSANMQKGVKELLTKSSLYKDKLSERLVPVPSK